MNDHATPAPAADPQETDVWWGAYSGWTMLPSLLVCIALTGVIVWGAGTYVERRHVQWTIWVLGGAVWLVQTGRWARRIFGWTYRLTNRRLFIDNGHLRPWRRVITLADIVHVEATRPGLGKWTGIGDVIVTVGPERKQHVLFGVSRPEEAAGRITSARQATGRPV